MHRPKVNSIKRGKHVEGHSSPSQRLKADSYPTGIKNPQGKPADSYLAPKKSKMKVKPKNLA